MESIEINPEGRFENWEPRFLDELLKQPIAETVGQEITFENGQIRVWYIALQGGSRLPFHRHTRNYNWTCLIEGKAISRYENGVIKELTYQKGDLAYYDHDSEGDFVHDLENVEETVLVFVTTEYK